MINNAVLNGLVSVGTLICFSFFIAVVIRTFSQRRRLIYVEAAAMPFDLPDEFESTEMRQSSFQQPVRR